MEHRLDSAGAGVVPLVGELSAAGVHLLSAPNHQLSGVITDDDIADADDIRRDRALAEYGEFASRQLGAERVLAAADVAERIVNAVASAVAEQDQDQRRRRGS